MQRSGSCGLFGGLILGALFTVIGYVVGFYFGKPILDNAQASRSWPSVPGVVERSEVVTSRSDGKTMYGFDVVYNYQIDERDLTCNCVFFGGDMTTSSSSPAHKVVGRYAKGVEVEVFYDPDEPSNAVLEPGAHWQSYLVFGIGMVFLVIGLLVFGSSLFYLLVGGLVLGGAMAGWIGGSAGRSQTADRFGFDRTPGGPQAPPDRRTETTESGDDGFDIG